MTFGGLLVMLIQDGIRDPKIKRRVERRWLVSSLRHDYVFIFSRLPFNGLHQAIQPIYKGIKSTQLLLSKYGQSQFPHNLLLMVCTSVLTKTHVCE